MNDVLIAAIVLKHRIALHYCHIKQLNCLNTKQADQVAYTQTVSTGANGLASERVLPELSCPLNQSKLRVPRQISVEVAHVNKELEK